MKTTRRLIGVGMALVLIAGVDCHAGEKGQRKKAVAVVESKSDSHLTGKATFIEVNGNVTLKLRIKEAEPGSHAVHLHENGDCAAPDAATAGGHWNPTNEDHGKWVTPPFHHGDIGNVEVGTDGRGFLALTTNLWTIGGATETDVVGKSIIVHAKADDFTTQPTGNAGGRVGCGVVRPARKQALATENEGLRPARPAGGGDERPERR